MNQTDTTQTLHPPSITRVVTIHALAFFTGFSVLSLEILGGRVLQPEFGSGLHVWGSILSVFMVSLSIGYWIGGKLSAKRASLSVLMIFPLTGGCIIFLLPNVYTPLNELLFEIVVIQWDTRESFASLLAATLEFLLPSVILGCVSPYSVRMLARDVSTSGKTAGNLFALSTIGSTIGALFTSFWGVSLFGVESLFRYLGGGLFVISIVFLTFSTLTRRKHGS